MLKLKDIRVSIKLSILISVAIIGFISLSLISANTLSRNLTFERESRLKAVVNAALSQIADFNQRYSKEEAQARTKELIEATRFDGNNYLYIIDTSRRILAHPIRADLIGQQMGDASKGSKEHYWYDMVNAGQRPNGGIVTYPWTNGNMQASNKIAYLRNFQAWGWIVGAGMLTDDIAQEVNNQVLKMAGATLLIIVIMILLGYIISSSVVKPLEDIKQAMKSVADGDLTAKIPVHGQDEIGIVAMRINESIRSVRKALLESVNSAKQLADAATRIASSAEETSQAVTNQRDQLNQLATAMNQMSATVAEVAGYAESTATDTINASKEAKLGNNDVSLSVDSIKTLSVELESATDQVNKLKEGVMEISDVTSVISSISEQTNLLALNAAIEAARAGEQGRGFAVVADEVRNLAARTNQSTEEIQSTINRLQKLAVDTASVMQKSKDLAHVSVQSAESCGSDLGTIVSHIEHVSDQSTQIATAAEEQSAVAEDMNRNVSGINDAALEMTQASGYLASESETLASMSQQLDERLSLFKLQ
ncbi:MULTISPECIES: methyl-accepting chemotaxis protein [unclassified Agarivorans]|uniref:methyl-accepting chemotaxis protein n=1 Tax=unclassified Agarivorans TaxID=2636026 RepID=UPI003D7C6BD4